MWFFDILTNPHICKINKHNSGGNTELLSIKISNTSFLLCFIVRYFSLVYSLELTEAKCRKVRIRLLFRIEHLRHFNAFEASSSQPFPINVHFAGPLYLHFHIARLDIVPPHSIELLVHPSQISVVVVCRVSVNVINDVKQSRAWVMYKAQCYHSVDEH